MCVHKENKNNINTETADSIQLYPQCKSKIIKKTTKIKIADIEYISNKKVFVS